MATLNSPLPGLRNALELNFLAVLMPQLQAWMGVDQLARTTQVEGFYSPTLGAYPQVTVQARMPSFRPRFSGHVYSNPPIPAGSTYQTEIPLLGGVIEDAEVDVVVKSANVAERGQLSDAVWNAMWTGSNSYGVAWRDVLDYYGIKLMGNHPDQFETIPQGEDDLNAPEIFANTITFMCRTIYGSYAVQQPGMDRVTIVATLVVPEGQSPLWESVPITIPVV